MKLTKDKKILIIGLGVIGGSYAMSLSKQGYDISCITRTKEHIDFALEKGIISRGETFNSPQLIGSADIIVIAIYPVACVEWVKENQQYFKSGCIITDVTGVKSKVVYEIQKILRKDVEFIAAHPMAGREQSGVAFADDKVFQGANYIVTPTKENTEEAISLCKDLGTVLGFSTISELSPEYHDKMIAFLSQLTHCIAISLMTCNQTPELEKYTGDSFRDLTRIAKINDKMWSELFIENKKPLIHEMDRFIAEFQKLRGFIEDENVDEMRQMMRSSTMRRTLFDKKNN
jgi:prephenate dehydrogenase